MRVTILITLVTLCFGLYTYVEPNMQSYEQKLLEIKQNILGLEADEVNLNKALSEKTAEYQRLNAVNPDEQALIKKLRDVITMNRNERSKMLFQLRETISRLPELEQARLIRKFEIEKYVRVYDYLVPYLRENPYVEIPSPFNRTFKQAFAAGDAYNAQIDKLQGSYDVAKIKSQIDNMKIKKIVEEWKSELEGFEKNKKCEVDMKKYAELKNSNLKKLLTDEEMDVKLEVKANIELLKQIKVKKETILKHLNKMVGNKLYEPEERIHLNRTIDSITYDIHSIELKLKDTSRYDIMVTEHGKINTEFKELSTKTGKIASEEYCKKYVKYMGMSLQEIRSAIKKLAFLEKLSQTMDLSKVNINKVQEPVPAKEIKKTETSEVKKIEKKTEEAAKEAVKKTEEVAKKAENVAKEAVKKTEQAAKAALMKAEKVAQKVAKLDVSKSIADAFDKSKNVVSSTIQKVPTTMNNVISNTTVPLSNAVQPSISKAEQKIDKAMKKIAKANIEIAAKKEELRKL